jgi:hypothetical protein
MKVWHLTLIAVLAVGASLPVYMGTKDTVTITVQDKERVNQGESSRYLVFTDSEVFENTDTLLFGKFNSSDIYGRMEEGRTYEAEVVGWRIPILSAHRNILTVEEVTAAY